MNVIRREVQTRRAEYVVPLPCYAKDLQDALAWALADLRDAEVWICDDTISVSADDENIILSFPIKAEVDETTKRPETPPFAQPPVTLIGDPNDPSTWRAPKGYNGIMIIPEET